MKVIKKWFSTKLDEIIPDDDILVDYLEELLIKDHSPDIKDIYEQLKTFIGDDGQTMNFCKDLWALLLEAQDDKDGLPKSLIEDHMKASKERDENDNKKSESVSKPNEEVTNKEDQFKETKSKVLPPHHSRHKGQPHKISKPRPMKTDRYIPTKPKSTSSTYNASKRLKSFDKEDNVDLNRF
ncbi:hypothetical protein CLIB1444_10S00936 [[Candida] jaroonii]|uniref:Uncharacterized protein n=1 Tax=[Candida] jaroonii TaxID=467808 RepID=A0ACA9YCQ8_9ASCO|nr:hypothetical protein CLIB1444_10S00936 [[Candida] jaroonii]